MDRLTTSHDRFAKEIGFDYGNRNSDVQAALFNGFAEGFYDQRYDYNMQMAYLVHELKPQAKRFLLAISEFVKED